MRELLRAIVGRKREEVEVLRRDGLPAARGRLARSGRASFATALAAPGVGVVAEIKRRSPSAGPLLPPGADVAHLARQLARAGASAISVLTDATWFDGSLHDLAAVRRAVNLPLLRKDFVIDPLQLEEARAFGADAVLLIARILSVRELRLLVAESARLDLAAVVEVHDEREVDAAVASGAQILGFNSRDLDTLAVDLPRMLRMRALAPRGRLALAESGVRSSEDLERVRRAGFDAALVGETLLRASDPGGRLAELLATTGGGSRRSTFVKICGITRLEDALLAVEAGADALGFVLTRSPRRIAAERAREIVERLPASVRTVGVFRDEPVGAVGATAELAGVGAIQLHGVETPQICTELKSAVIQRFEVRVDDGPASLRERTSRFGAAEAWLLDPGAGDGVRFDWSIARGLGPRVILAGGLDAGNVAGAMRAAEPWGVDVSSGVEAAPGIKDPRRLRAFVRAVKQEDGRRASR